MTSATFGSISTATLRPQDLVPIFAATLRDLVQKNPELWEGDDGLAERDSFRAIVEEAEAVDFAASPDPDKIESIMESLIDALNEFAPPHAYFGTHSDDLADYGFWLFSDAVESFDGLKVSDTSEVPADFTGEVMHVNDHGNVTLYNADNGTLTEVWSLV